MIKGCPLQAVSRDVGGVNTPQRALLLTGRKRSGNASDIRTRWSVRATLSASENVKGITDATAGR